jgi:hypothetical protein
MIVTRAEDEKQAHHRIREHGRITDHKIDSEMVISRSSKWCKNG